MSSPIRILLVEDQQLLREALKGLLGLNEDIRIVGEASDGAEALALIFDAFAQEGQWVTSEFGGLGLGLAIAKATVDAHHGTLVAASGGRNQGATFTITLPIGRAHSS